jgi:hypothetical protein
MQAHSQPMLEPTQDNKKSIASNRRIDLLVGTGEGLTIAGIFVSFLTKTTQDFLEKTGHYIFFPAAGLLNLVRTGLAFNQGRLENWKNGTKEKAILEAGSSVMVGTAVIGGLVDAPYAKFGGHIFTGMLAGKTGFHAGATLYYMGKSAGSADEAEKLHYKNVAKVNGIAATSLLLSTGATGAVMVLGETVGYAELGILANLFAAGYQLYSAYNIQTPTSSITIEDDIDNEHEEEANLERGNAAGQTATPTYQPPMGMSPNSAGISRTLGITPSMSPSSPSVNSSLVNDHVIKVSTSPAIKSSLIPGSQPTVPNDDRRSYQRL